MWRPRISDKFLQSRVWCERGGCGCSRFMNIKVMLNKDENCLSSLRMWRSEARREPLAQGLRYGTKKNICIKQSCQNTVPVSATIILPVQGARRDSRATTAYNDFSCTRHGLYTDDSIDAALSQRRLNPSTPFQKQTPCRFFQQRPTAH